MKSFIVLGILTTILFVNCFVHCTKSPYQYKTKYFKTKLDHFSFTTNETFNLRYLTNDNYWAEEDNAPIFFYTGHEGDITLFAENTGLMWELAQEFNALIVFAEHRFYGKSNPHYRKSNHLDKLGFLTTSQALMDFVELIAWLRGSENDNPVIVFGGSYGGMLAAWMRIKYPASVAGAIASSAPIWLFSGITRSCDGFYRVLTSVFTHESPECSKNIRLSWNVITKTGSSNHGRKWLSKNWKLCKPIAKLKSLSNLKDYIGTVYSNLAMVNYPYPTSYLAPLPEYPIQEFCSYFSGSYDSKEDLLSALFEGLNVYFNYTKKARCFDYSSAYDHRLGIANWDYQTCTEMVMPMCTTGEYDMFEPSKWNIKEHIKRCNEIYNVMPQVNKIKHLYGGTDLSSASNIIFSNGLLDPWSSGGVLKDVSKTVIAVVLHGAAHHLDLRASHPLDPESVVLARLQYGKAISSWITRHYYEFN